MLIREFGSVLVFMLFIVEKVLSHKYVDPKMDKRRTAMSNKGLTAGSLASALQNLQTSVEACFSFKVKLHWRSTSAS